MNQPERADDVRIVFTPSGKRGEVAYGTSVLQAAQKLGVDLDTVCGGRGLCDRCQVDLSPGEFDKLGLISAVEHLSELSANERDLFSKQQFPITHRLGCQARVIGDVVIDIPAQSQAHRQIVRKRAEAHEINVNPVVRLYYVEVPEPNMYEPSSDLQRLCEALEFEWGLTGLSCNHTLLSGLQSVLRHGQWRVTVAVRNNNHLVDAWPGIKQHIYGLAIDVGSTTIAAHLCDLISGEVLDSAGRMNEQIRFGEDLMSRVSYAMINPGGDEAMTHAVRHTIQQLIDELVQGAEIEKRDILELVLVGNPVMHHLLLGINPVELGRAPFALATDGAVTPKAAELELDVNREARAYILPCIAGHVGADAAAVVLSEAPYLHDEMTLIVDVGTNAEILLANNKRMLAASSPTGPAFEGAQISGGQRAAPGAIERVRIDKQTLEARIKVIGCDLWSDHPDFERAIENIGVTGICGSGIIEVMAELFLAGVITHDGVINGELSQKSTRIVQEDKTWSYLLHSGQLEIKITQNDVRAIQLAKAALYAGARLLMEIMGVQRVERIRLAGAFGSHIDVRYAMILGMIPDCRLENVTSAGNAAGTGACIALLDGSARNEIESVVKTIHKIETAVEEKFQKHFIDALSIPHAKEHFSELAKVVELPQKSEVMSINRRRKRRRAP